MDSNSTATAYKVTQWEEEARVIAKLYTQGFMTCPHGNLHASCFDCDVIAMAKLHSPVSMWDVAKDMVQSLTPKPKKRTMKVLGQVVEHSKTKSCRHANFNYVSNGEGGFNVWCTDCGDKLPESLAIDKVLGLPVTQTSETEPEHELDVIQRLSEAYRTNEREIEAETEDEEKRKTLGTLSTGPK